MKSWPKKPKPAPLRTHEALRRRIRDPLVSSDAKALWFCIDSYADGNGEECYPSGARLARDLRWSRNKVFRVIKLLDSIGWIARSHTIGSSNSFLVIYSKTGKNPPAQKPKRTPLKPLKPVSTVDTRPVSTVNTVPVPMYQAGNCA